MGQCKGAVLGITMALDLYLYSRSRDRTNALALGILQWLTSLLYLLPCANQGAAALLLRFVLGSQMYKVRLGTPSQFRLGLAPLLNLFRFGC